MVAAAWLLAAAHAAADITETTVRPLRRLFDCRGAASSSAACGPAVPNRTNWPNKYCGLDRIQNETRLAGFVLDIVVIPDEDETLILFDNDGNTYLGGIVGEILTQIASEGRFEFNAIMVDPPGPEYADWTTFALDWVNRADLLAAWYYDNRVRRGSGLAYPYNFYALSPMAVVLEQTKARPMNIEAEYFQFMMPFTWELWGAILGMFVFVTLALGFIEGRLFIAPREVPKGGYSGAHTFGFNLRAWLDEFFLASMAFCQAGGWWGMSQARTPSGRFLSLFTEFGILIILSAYLGNITNLMLREQGGLTVLSAKSFEDLLSRDENICFRQQTALGEVMRNLDVDPAQLIDFGNATGGFAAQVAYGAELMRAGRCSAMILPEWFAENTLVMGANEPCDLRLIRRSIRTITGGYVTASPYSRLKALKAKNPDAAMEDIGCMDLVAETLGVLLQGFLSEDLQSLRVKQRMRIKEEHGSACTFDGKAGGSGAAGSGSSRRRRLSRGAGPTHPQAGSRAGRRQLKAAASASSTASAAVNNLDASPAEEVDDVEDLKLHLKHFKGFFILMAILLFFTLATSPRLDWLFVHKAEAGLRKVKTSELARKISVKRGALSRAHSSSGSKDHSEAQLSVGSEVDVSTKPGHHESVLAKLSHHVAHDIHEIGAELHHVAEELFKDEGTSLVGERLQSASPTNEEEDEDENNAENPASIPTDEPGNDRGPLKRQGTRKLQNDQQMSRSANDATMMAILKELQESVQEIKAEQARCRENSSSYKV